MSDPLSEQLREYYDAVVSRTDPTVDPNENRRVEGLRGVGVGMAVAVTVLLGGALTLLIRSPEEPVTAPTSVVASTTTTTTVQSASPELTQSSVDELEAPSAPWSGPVLPPEDVEPLLTSTWSVSVSRHTCSLLAPADLGSEGAGAVPRQAGFGPYPEVFVSWDNPDGPGMTGSSELCEDCGRSAFGIHLTGLETDRESQDGPIGLSSVVWSDGSELRFGSPTERSYADGHSRLLGNLITGGEACRYQVWSSLGEEHLLRFVDQLRFVEGHRALLTETEPPQQAVTQAGDPPWDSGPLSPEEVDDLLVERWSEAAERLDGERQACPLLAFADLGADVESATVRTADFGDWGVAWDNPSGLGHDGLNQPCSDCGRGVVGLTGDGPAHELEQVERPRRIEWSDGSHAEYGYTGIPFVLLPEEEVSVPDPNTGDPATPAQHAVVEVAAHPDCRYELWSHLGTGHVEFLLRQLRYVEGAP